MIYGIIMAGGRGERFWPHSRANKPKQFLRLTSDKTMLEETIERVKPLISSDYIRIVTGESMAPLIKESDLGLDRKNILSEPIGRNTCLAIALAAVHVRHEDPEGVMVVLSADHLIRPAAKLLQILKAASDIAAKEKYLITLGIVPTRPETQYGYIKCGKSFDCESDCQVYHVEAFAEKPKAVIAQEYYRDRSYLWNSGMFIWSANSFLDALSECETKMSKHLEEYAKSIGQSNEAEARKKLYDEATSISVDYAILEKAKNVLAIKADIVWDDVGSWGSLERFKDKNSDNNVLIGETITNDTYETTILNDQPGLVACLGVCDLVIVRSGDVTLVAHKSKLDKIKELLAQVGEDEDLRAYL